MKIVIGGDLAPTKYNFELFAENRVRELVDEACLDIIRKADFSIFNLETPLTDIDNPIEKKGPALSAPENTINVIREMKIDLFCLANNHILDQGNKGLQNTISVIRKNKVQVVGAGDNLRDAKMPYIKTIEGVRIGVYACAEHEFSISTEDTAGANPYDPLTSFDDVRSLKKNVDYLIVLFHGGIEKYRYPSPNLLRICRKFVECGADFITCQHTHCIGAFEKYNNSTIVYGQGDFLFDRSDNSMLDTGMLISVGIDIQNPDRHEVDFIPLIKDKHYLRIANDEERSMILNDFYARSEQIKIQENVVKLFSEFCQHNLGGYLKGLGGRKTKNIIYRIFCKLTKQKCILYNYTKEDYLQLINFLDCESHQEILKKCILLGYKERRRINSNQETEG